MSEEEPKGFDKKVMDILALMRRWDKVLAEMNQDDKELVLRFLNKRHGEHK